MQGLCCFKLGVYGPKRQYSFNIYHMVDYYIPLIAIVAKLSFSVFNQKDGSTKSNFWPKKLVSNKGILVFLLHLVDIPSIIIEKDFLATRAFNI